MQNRKYAFGAVFAAIFVLLAAGGGWAIHLGVSQYILVKAKDGNTVRVYNPTGQTMFALGIFYRDDESFDFCEGLIITPNGSDFFSTDSCDNCFSGQIISVPTGAAAGALNHKFGLRAKGSSGRYDYPLDPLLFSFELDAVRECACDELANANKSPRLLARFGIRCP